MKRLISLLLLVLISVQVIYVSSGVIANPYATGDAYAIWYLKTKAFGQSLVDPGLAYSHPEYPILYPLVLTLISSNWHVYLWLGPVIFIAIILVSYFYAGLPAAFAVSSVMIRARLGGRGEVGFADWPLSLMYLFCFYYFGRKKISYFWLGVIWGLTANIKMEGLIGAILFCLVYLPREKKFYIPFLPLALWWPVTAAGLGLKTIYQGGTKWTMDRIPEVAKLLFKSLTDWRRFGLWPVLAAVVKPSRVHLWIWLYLLALAASYLWTPLDLKQHWETSYYRIMVQVLPLLICLVFIEVRKWHISRRLFW